MEDRRKKGILAVENPEGVEPDLEEMWQLFGRTDDSKDVSAPGQLSEDLDAPESSSPDEELPDQETTRTFDPKILIEDKPEGPQEPYTAPFV